MGLVRAVLHLAVLVFFLILLVRMVLDWVQVFARTWRPTGVALVVAEATSSMRAPAKPCSANSANAASRIAARRCSGAARRERGLAAASGMMDPSVLTGQY